MPSVILDTGFETFRLTSANTELWQSAPSLHTPLQAIQFIFNVILHFILELSYMLCGKLDRGLKVERLYYTSASRVFNYCSDLCLATNLGTALNSIEEQALKGLCKGCNNSDESKPVRSGCTTYFCKNCKKHRLESALFQTLMKFNNRIHSAKSSGGMHGLLSYAKQRHLILQDAVEISDKFEGICDDSSCNICYSQDKRDEYTLDPALYEQLICRISFLDELISSCAISPTLARKVIDWVDSSFGASTSVNTGEESSQG